MFHHGEADYQRIILSQCADQGINLSEEMGFQKIFESAYGSGVLNVLRERIPEGGGCTPEGSSSHGGFVSRCGEQAGWRRRNLENRLLM